METRKIKHRIFFAGEEGTRLGQLKLAAEMWDSAGVVPAFPLRVYGSYAIVFITNGIGMYRDVHRRRFDVPAGSAIVVFPEVAHSYGPLPGTVWDEVYFVFDGPAFGELRMSGVIDPSRPILTPDVAAGRHIQLTEVLMARYPSTEVGRLARLTRFLYNLTDLLSSGERAEEVETWVQRAKRLLDRDLAEPVGMESIAESMGIDYEMFRKRFRKQSGVSPAQYRLRRRIDTAVDLLRYTTMTNAQIADVLGFADEFAFSKRFKTIIELSPRNFRKRWRSANDGEDNDQTSS